MDGPEVKPLPAVGRQVESLTDVDTQN